MMSEEQPTFKVRDRRLFNADGTPREVEREGTPERSTASAASAPAAAEPETANLSSASDEAAETPSRGTAASGEQAGHDAASSSSVMTGERQAEGESFPGGQGQAEEDLYTDEEVPGADNPTSFVNFLMSIASNAAASLGMMEHPVTGQRGVDLPLAKHWIDVLGMLHEKTRGNLVAQEQQIFEGLLSELRLQYVSLTTPPAGPRGFTGRDILGGK
ncbi:MAG TPA: DUF1844 domain-containing protein [Pyrinomonadaceae bacterium]|jgi:hypothetical protein